MIHPLHLHPLVQQEIQGLMEKSDWTQKAELAKPLRTRERPEFTDEAR